MYCLKRSIAGQKKCGKKEKGKAKPKTEQTGFFHVTCM
jgi:hypothetical protein